MWLHRNLCGFTPSLYSLPFNLKIFWILYQILSTDLELVSMYSYKYYSTMHDMHGLCYWIRYFICSYHSKQLFFFFTSFIQDDIITRHCITIHIVFGIQLCHNVQISILDTFIQIKCKNIFFAIILYIKPFCTSFNCT